MPRSFPSNRRLSPRQIALIYLAFGFVALFLSDYVLPVFFEGARLRYLQGIKGALEIPRSDDTGTTIRLTVRTAD